MDDIAYERIKSELSWLSIGELLVICEYKTGEIRYKLIDKLRYNALVN